MTTEFDRGVDQMEGRECGDDCHFGDHDAPAAPERGASTWHKEYTYGRGYRINDSLGCVAEVREEALTDLIITEHNQYSTLIAQREHLMRAAQSVVERLKDLPRFLEKNDSSALASIVAESLADLAAAIPVLTTIEQERGRGDD